MAAIPDHWRAEFDGLQKHEIEARIRGSIWNAQKSKAAQQYLDEQSLALKKAEQAGPVRVTWAGIIVTAIIAAVGGLYTIWPRVIEAIAVFKGWLASQ